MMTIRAIAVSKTIENSDVSTADYYINWKKCATPQFNPAPGLYTYPLNIVIITSTLGASVKYTTDGTDPRTSATALPGSSVSINAYTTVKACAEKDGKLVSNVGTGTYLIYEDLGMVSPANSGRSSVKVGSDNKPVVVFADGDCDQMAHVKKLSSGSEWSDLGFASYSTTENLISLALDSNDIPYVGYGDYWMDHRPRVTMWESDTVWEDLGFTDENLTGNSSIAIGPDNKPVVLHLDVVSGGNNSPHVLKWDSGTTWTDLGHPTGNEAWDLELVVANDGIPFVGIIDSTVGKRIHVMKWISDTTWDDLGFASEPLGNSYMEMDIGPDNKPVIFFIDTLNGDRGRVVKWVSGTSWTDLGFTSAGAISTPSIAVGPDGKPVVAFTTYASFDRVQLKKWDSGSSWIDLGYPAPARASYPSVAIGPNNNPVVIFNDEEDNFKEHVRTCLLN